VLLGLGLDVARSFGLGLARCFGLASGRSRFARLLNLCGLVE
jgi:hypothetical protein